jgi:methylmalonyl-CoA carboxyltransferase large subunit
MDLATTLEQLQAQLAEISKRMKLLEGQEGAKATAAVPVQTDAVPSVLMESVPAGIAEEELLAISAAIGAYLGVRAHIRQIRLVSTSAWAQQGRVSIQASHRLQG